MKKTCVSARILVLSLVCAAFSVATAFSENNSSAQSANRRTAIRYLNLAKQYAGDKAWKEAESQAEIGLAYDDTIADLWYLEAISRSMQGESRAKVLPLVVKSLNDASWVDYNRDAARILYADILCNTGRNIEALSVLDSEPFLYSADAEYIRAKSFYNMQKDGGYDPEYTRKAREKIDAARRIYPQDVRFARLFFVHEYARRLQEAVEPAVPALVQKLADAFILQLSHYGDSDAELELYGAIFADDRQRNRMLRSFKARSLKAPLYAETALRAGLISEDEALDAFMAFADNCIDLSVLETFVPLLKSEKAKKDLTEYLTAYDGVLVSDTDGDLQPNLTVTYARGRPVTISYDENQDGDYAWTVDCDFGVPEVLHVTEGALDIQYVNWPYVQRALYMGENEQPALTFNLIGETLSWSPFWMGAVACVKEGLSLDFFYPELEVRAETVSGSQLLRASSSYELPSKERKDACIRVSLLDGVAQMARYYTASGQLYAQAHFEGGLPVLRTVDTDGDGLFETTETYGFVGRGLEQDYLSVSDEMQIMTNLFGSPVSGTGFYVSMIQVDSNGDTLPDFTEEYQAGEGKIASWDTDGDGLWDVRYVKQSRQDDGVNREEAYFHQPLTKAVVCVKSEDGKPVSVSEDGKELAVTEKSGIYWLGEAGSADAAEKIHGAINQIATQGVSVVVEHEGERLLSVRAGNMIFGEKLLPRPAEAAEENDDTEDLAE